MPLDPTDKSIRGRVARQVHVAREIGREPRSAVGFLRGWLVGLWQARGGGFYGLGFVVVFVVLEIRMIVEDFSGGDSVSDVVVQQVVELALRFGVESFINGLLALLWPLFVLDRLGAWGIAVIVGGYLIFERLLRPMIEARVPELKETRLQKALLKRQKKEQKRAAKAGKRRK